MQSREHICTAVDPLPHGLLNPAAYPHKVTDLHIVETHISWVVLTGEFAYKIKKPVALDFVDFSTLAKRRFFCQEELRLNRRFARELYLDVVPIGGTRAAPRFGRTPAIEYAVKLVQFPEASRLDHQLRHGALTEGDARQLGEIIARYQSKPVGPSGQPTFGSADSIRRLVLENLAETTSLLGDGVTDLDTVSTWTRRAVRELGPLLQQRQKLGFVREGHGDLHLQNLVRLDDKRIAPFDALEFDASMRWTDTVDEVAFLAMDLMARGRRDLAWLLLNRYFECCGDYAGVSVLRFYLVYRALVRAKVSLLRSGAGDNATLPGGAAAYLDLASELTRSRQPLLILMHGLSGSGKTTVSESLIGALGALRIRSDLERKRLHDLDALASSDSAVDEGIYDEAATDRTYAALAQGAEIALRAGFDVILDATFLKKSRRDRFRDLAADEGARRIIVDCRASVPVLRQRLSERLALANDPSEADHKVLNAQASSCETLCWDEQCSQVLVNGARNAHVPTLVREILATGNRPH